MKNLFYIAAMAIMLSSCFQYEDSVPVIQEQTLEEFHVKGNINGNDIDANLNLYQLLFSTNDKGSGDRRFIWSQYQFKNPDNKAVQEINDLSGERCLTEVNIQFIEAQEFQPADWIDKPLFLRTDSNGSASEPTGLTTIILYTSDGILAKRNDYVEGQNSNSRVIEVSDGTYLNDSLLKVVTIRLDDEFRLFEDELTPWAGETVRLKDVEVKVLMKIRQS